MADKIATSRAGDVTKYFGLQWDGDKATHYRGYTQNLNPVAARAKLLAQTEDPRSKYKFSASVPMAVLLDWLTRNGKTLHDFAVDKDLENKFGQWFTYEYKKMTAGEYRV